jgi:hypothetical protein
VALVIARVDDRPDDAAADRVGTAVAVPLEHDRRPVVGLDDGAEIGAEGTVLAAAREVCPPEPAADTSVAPSLGEVEVLLPTAAQPDCPPLRIGEAQPIERFEVDQARLSRISMG